MDILTFKSRAFQIFFLLNIKLVYLLKNVVEQKLTNRYDSSEYDLSISLHHNAYAFILFPEGDNDDCHLNFEYKIILIFLYS
ncbi:hypothetical protein SAMN05421766_1176 [Zobellia uliginosa]|uniref:Uncharacterized protein n=1 Tax=Zobellia uliginosa TaxID=143224 RepID=A0ABY1L2V1_9FLAO|nr:hypothetical protein SAMN05421766_1176 [Zobellia uliginosa]